MRPGFAFAAFCSLALLLISAPSWTHAATKSCRRCKCDVTMSGYVLTSDVDSFFSSIMPPVMGGDDFYWLTNKPGPPYFNATMHVPRMCGNGGGFQMTRDLQMHPPPEQKAVATFTCKCDHSAVCKKGSACQKSGIGG